MTPFLSGTGRRTTTHGKRRLLVGGAAVLVCAFSVAQLAAPGVARGAQAHRTGSGTIATVLPPSLVKFAHCPVDNPLVTLCIYSATTSTTFTIGSTTVSSTKRSALSLGAYQDSAGNFVAVLPDDGSQALVSPAIPLPGGLTGIPGLGGGVLQVTVTPQVVALPGLSLANLITGKGAGLVLPLDILVSTPTGLLGSSCTIGDAADPVTLQLTTGTTAPPPPNTPISGAPGTLTSRNHGELIISGLKLVDNAFAVPGAYGCGLLGALDPVLDLDKSLPSAAGKNAAVLGGTAYTMPAAAIRSYVG